MAEEGQSAITRYFNGKKLNPLTSWKPSPTAEANLVIKFPRPSYITGIRVTDELAPVLFKYSYKPDVEGAEFVKYEDDNGEEVVSYNFLLILKEKY